MGGVSNPAPCSFCKGTRGMVDNFLADVKRWAAKPYDDNMDAFQWALFLGFMLCVTFLWSRVIRAILGD